MLLDMHRAKRTERERGAGSCASRQRWQTVGAECTAAHLQARLRVIGTPISMAATRQKRSPGDVKYRR
jgi:hypothetical protein